RAMHVEKRDAISLTKFSAMNVAHTPANFAQASDRYVSRYKRIRNSCELPLLQIEISSANLRQLNIKQGRVSFKFRRRHLTQFDRRVRLRDNCNQRHGG